MIAANLTLSPLTAPLFKSAPVSELCVSAFNSPNCFSPNSFRIRTYAKYARNPFTMNTSKTQDLKPFRMNTYEKTPRGEGQLFSFTSSISFTSFTSVQARYYPSLSIHP
jgi:hypothetical protein